MRILVVDDDEAVRDSLARTLRFEGHQVDTAGDDRNAIDIVHAGKPDAMILDVSMPEMDGIETCRRLSADGATAGHPGRTARAVVRRPGRRRARGHRQIHRERRR